MVNLKCLGAVGEVTGSCHLVTVGGYKILLDCGLFQGSRKSEERNRESFHFNPSEIDAVILSHAHIDHSGRIPLLVKSGFSGPIYAHKATRDLCKIMLKDSAFLNEKDVEWENKRRARKGRPPLEPLYGIDDAELAMKSFKSLRYDVLREILPGIKLRLQDAGHILGSSLVELLIDDAGIEKKIVYSGDLGHSNAPILKNPAIIEQADLVIMESTYGDRLHRSWEDTRDEFIDIIAAAKSDKGNILIPAFAVGRSQLVLYWFAEQFAAAGLGDWKIFLDSPMATQATQAYIQHTDLYDANAADMWRRHQDSSLLQNLHITRTPNQSRALNNIRAGAIIIAGSGMCTGGRIRHHLFNNVWRRECHVIIVGYQAFGTTGRALVDGAKYIKLRGEQVRVAAKVHTVGGLSAHADQGGLIHWYQQFKGRPKLVLVHGEAQVQQTFADKVEQVLQAPVQIARPEETMTI